MMDNTSLELIRINLLQLLRAASPHEVPASRLVTGVRIGGYREADANFVTTELTYLADKGLVFSPEKLVSPENREWRITAAGRDHLAQRGF